MRGARGAALLAAVGCGLLALGCPSRSAPPDRYFRLEGPAPAARLASPVFTGTVEVSRLRTDPVTGDRSMLYRARRDDGEIGRHAYLRWSDSPGAMLQVEIARYLRAAGAAERVVTPDFDVDADYTIFGHLHRFERVLEVPAAVLLELELAVRRRGRSDLLLHRTYRAERAASGDGVEAALTAWRAALADVLGRFLADVESLPRR